MTACEVHTGLRGFLGAAGNAMFNVQQHCAGAAIRENAGRVIPSPAQPAALWQRVLSSLPPAIIRIVSDIMQAEGISARMGAIELRNFAGANRQQVERVR